MKITSWKRQPWWELDEGWRVHVNPESPNFGRCWNTKSGDETDFTTLRLALYGDSLPAWEALIEKAIAHGRNPSPRAEAVPHPTPPGTNLKPS